MNNIFTRFATVALVSSVAATAIYAATPSKLFVNPDATTYNTEAGTDLDGENLSTSDANISIDRVGIGSSTQLVFQPFVNLTSGSKFRLLAEGGAFVLATEASLCDGNTTIGTMVNTGALDQEAGTMNNMLFRIIDNTNQDFKDAHFAKDGNYTFAAANTCDGQPALQITAVGDACNPVNISIPFAIDDSGLEFDDYKAPAIKVGETKRLVTITCDVPVCSISVNNNTQFTTAVTPTGINQSLNSEENLTAVLTASSFDNCLECDETMTVLGASSTSCTTKITIKNRSTDFNITRGTVTPMFTDNKNAGMTFDSNGSSTAFGALAELDINVTAGNTETFNVTYTPVLGQEIEEGSVTGDIKLFSGTDELTTSRKTNELAVFSLAGQTKFTVPYMYATSSVKNFVRVNTRSDSGATISANIIDAKGNTCNIADADFNGDLAKPFGSAVIWASDLKTAATTAGCTLESNLWTVDFTTSAAATVVSYMRTSSGERTVNPF